MEVHLQYVYMNVRSAEKTELDRLAAIWHVVWHESHAPLMPAELTRLRTLENFRDRLGALLSEMRVTGPAGSPVGFCIVRDDELYQLYLSAEARGTGAAAALLADAEARLAAGGVKVAWLACAVGNERAARFYEKSGWRREGTEVIEVDTSEGPFSLEIWRFEKPLADGA
jgi:ribosomal protein S18 acetylase RimI-like enzyme